MTGEMQIVRQTPGRKRRLDIAATQKIDVVLRRETGPSVLKLSRLVGLNFEQPWEGGNITCEFFPCGLGRGVARTDGSLAPGGA